MKKLALVFLSLAGSAHAFDLSAVGTVNFESSRVSNLVGTVSTSGETGVGVGGLIQFDVGTSLGFQTGALIIKRGYTMGPDTFSFNRLQVPAMFRITSLPIISFGAGAYMEVSMGDIEIDNSVTKIKSSSSYSSRAFSGTDFGVVAAVGADIPLAPLLSITLDLRYNLGLIDYDDSSVSRKFGGFQMLGGLKFSL